MFCFSALGREGLTQQIEIDADTDQPQFGSIKAKRIFTYENKIFMIFLNF